MGKAIIISDVDFASANLGRVTLTENVPLESLLIAPVTDTVINSHQMVVVYNPVNTTERGVIWRITAGQQYASIDANTGLLTVNEGVTEEDVTVEVESTVNPSIKATLDIVVSQRAPTLTWYVDSTAYVAQVNGWDSRYFPLMVKQVPALDNKVVNRVKFYATISGATSVKLAKYSFNNSNAPTLVSEIGVYQIVDGENIISFTDTELLQGQIIGVKEYIGTSGNTIGIKYKTTAIGTSIDGGWAKQAFRGTIFFAIGYYGL